MIDFRRWEYQGNNLINKQTGECYAFKDSFVQNSDNEEFVKCYCESLNKFPVLARSEYALFIYLLNEMGYITTNKRTTLFSRKERLRAADQLGLGIDSINKAVSGLYKRGLIIKLKHNHIQVNPEIAAKGNENSIQAIRTTLLKVSEEVVKITEFGGKK